MIYFLGLFLKKKPIYDLVPAARKRATLSAWRRRERLTFFLGVAYCVGCTGYVSAFCLVISPDLCWH